MTCEQLKASVNGEVVCVWDEVCDGECVCTCVRALRPGHFQRFLELAISGSL